MKKFINYLNDFLQLIGILIISFFVLLTVAAEKLFCETDDERNLREYGHK